MTEVIVDFVDCKVVQVWKLLLNGGCPQLLIVGSMVVGLTIAWYDDGYCYRDDDGLNGYLSWE